MLFVAVLHLYTALYTGREIVEAIVSLQLSPSCLLIRRFPFYLFWLIFSRVSACIAFGAPDLIEFCQATGLPALF
jgi:hypothetical protein